MQGIGSALGVAYCGLYCPTCGTMRVGRCEGCKTGGGFSGCKVRACAMDRGYTTCAQCGEMESCPKLDNLLSRLYAWVFRTRRMENLREIRDHGLEPFVARMESQ